MPTPLEAQAKLIFYGIVLSFVAGAFAFTYSKGKQAGIEAEQVNTRALQTRFDEYQGSMEGQMKKAKEEAAQVKQQQEAKYAKAQSDYRRDTTILTDRLRDYEGVLCGEGQTSVRVDERGSSNLSTKGTSTAGTSDSIATPARPRPTFSYSDAIKDTQQCSKLIEFVKAM